MEQTFGDFLRERRIQLGYTLRKFCEKTDLDPAYVSRIENGIHAAPEKKEKLDALAIHYEVAPDSTDMATLLGLAYMSRKQLPDDLEISNPAALKYLPAFCRTASKKDITKEDVEQLLKLIKGEVSA